MKNQLLHSDNLHLFLLNGWHYSHTTFLSTPHYLINLMTQMTSPTHLTHSHHFLHRRHSLLNPHDLLHCLMSLFPLSRCSHFALLWFRLDEHSNLKVMIYWYLLLFYLIFQELFSFFWVSCHPISYQTYFSD